MMLIRCKGDVLVNTEHVVAAKQQNKKKPGVDETETVVAFTMSNKEVYYFEGNLRDAYLILTGRDMP
jgi:hypothetical protein